ncbi:MAG: AAA family ATPase [Caldilineaceae bacterium]|nr:AAA family ATPase [Caldilineaceae bacterium]
MSTRLTEEQVRQALTLWHQSDAHGSPFEELLLWQLMRRDGAPSVRSATNQVLLDALGVLANDDPEAQRLLELRFLREEPAQRVAPMLNVVEGTVWRKQREAISRLTEILEAQETQAHNERINRFAGRLPGAADRALFGVESHLTTLTGQVKGEDAPYLIAIEGIGGIGKTTLACALVRQLLGDAHWQEVAWVTAQQQLFNGGGAIKPITHPALTSEALVDALVEQLLREEIGTSALSMEQKRNMLQQRFRQHPHLVVIDNLETLQDIEALLGTLRTWLNPTKFILTSRISRYYETDIYHFIVPELSEDDAMALIHTEAAVRNNRALATAGDDELRPIYETVGGNPLALRLVVGQTQIHGLNRILGDLHAARGRSVEQLYHYIYWQVWNSLDELAQQALLLMPLVTETGGDIEYLTAMAAGGGLSAEDVGNALERLIGLNLVDSRGGLHERRYTIHALTNTFLQEQVLRWGDE